MGKNQEKVRNSMFEYYNNNPVRPEGGAGDCAVRAISKALDVTWEKAYVMLSLNGFLMGDMPTANFVIGSVLRENGFKRKSIPNECPECFSVDDFCESFPTGIYVVFSQDHVATVIDGVLYDSWNSSGNVPQFYWSRE